MSSKRVNPWLGVLAAGVVGVGLVTLGGVQHAGATAPAQRRAAPAVQQITMYILRGKINGQRGVPGPDGKGHDAFVPANLVLKAGVPVHLTVINYDEGGHSLIAPDLGLNLAAKPGQVVEASDKEKKESGKEAQTETVKPVTTTFTFTVRKKGVFRWFCPQPCDKGANYWAMGQGYSGMGKEGFMAGFIVAM